MDGDYLQGIADRLERFGDGGLDDLAQMIGQGERLATDGDREGAGWRMGVEVEREFEQRRGIEMMGKGAGKVLGRLDRDGGDGAGRGVGRAIDEDNGIGVADVLGEFGEQLVGEQHSEAGAGLLLHGAGDAPADSVIAAQRIAAGEQEGAPGLCRPAGLVRGVQRGRRHQSLRTWSRMEPSGASSSMTSGIWPKAWVAQLRQGSKVRMTASTRFNIPSVSLSALT